MTNKLKKSIVLFGTSLEGEIFYCNNKEKYDFEFAIDNYRNNAIFHSLKVFNLEEVKYDLADKYIVVATLESTYRIIKSDLEALGLTEYKDFIYSRWFNKKIAIIYGNCHMGQIAKMLACNPDFIRKYAIRYFPLNEGKKEQIFPNETDINSAELIIAHDVRKGNILNAPDCEWLRRMANMDAKVIIVPNLWGMNFVWPQVKVNRRQFEKESQKKHINADAIYNNENRNPNEQQRIISMTAGMISHHDYYIEDNVEKSSERIAQDIRNNDIFERKYILDFFKKAINDLKDREKNTDIIISDYIEHNISRMQLFYDEGHPHENIIIEKVRRILKLLNMNNYECRSNLNTLDSEEIFVYGCVKRALNMEWEKDYIRVGDSTYTFDNHGITLEEFVHAYKSWIILEE